MNGMESAAGAGMVSPDRDALPAALDTKPLPDSLLANLRLGRTLDHAGIGIVETDAAGRLIRVNAGLCELMGASEAELLGRSIFDETHAADVDPDRTLYARQVAGGLQ